MKYSLKSTVGRKWLIKAPNRMENHLRFEPLLNSVVDYAGKIPRTNGTNEHVSKLFFQDFP